MVDYTPNMVDYEKTCNEFKLEVPEYFNFGFDVVDKWAEDRTKLALVSVNPDDSVEKHTFWDIKTGSNRFANVLKKLGLKKGDRVFIMLPQCAEWYMCMIGMFKLGIVPMPATAMCTAKDVEYRIKTAGAVMAISDGTGAAKVDEVFDDVDCLTKRMVLGDKREGWLSYDDEVAGASLQIEGVEKTRSDDTLLLYFTSGTTSYPKMVLHTQASYAIGHRITAMFWQDLKPTDLHWTMSDTGWAKAAWGKLFGQWTVGAAVFQLEGKFDAKRTLRAMQDHGVTTFCAPPTVYRVMVNEDLKAFDLSSLRHCMAAGEPLNPEVMRIWKEGTDAHIYDGYGQTETVNLVANYRCMPIKPGSMGKPTPGFHVTVIDDEGNEVPPDTEGHIAVRVKPERPVGLFKEYWMEPDKTASVYMGDWYLTGDKAYKDTDGYLFFVGRADDVIITSGYRIGPFEVESALLEHPAVQESAVVAAPDETRGEVVKAFVILAPGFDGSDDLVKELQTHVKTVTAPYKYPRRIEFVTELPKTISGKIRRGELKEREWKDWKIT